METTVLPHVDSRGGATVTRGAPASAAAVCAALDGNYITVDDNAWRSTRNVHGGTYGWCDSPGSDGVGTAWCHGESDCDPAAGGTNVGGGRWYCFTGTDGLSLTPPGCTAGCSTYSGWLSGHVSTACQVGADCPNGGNCASGLCLPSNGYTGGGRYPTAIEGVVKMAACFSSDCRPQGLQRTCHRAVGVVRCDGFLLWRLPNSPGCETAYCTAT